METLNSNVLDYIQHAIASIHNISLRIMRESADSTIFDKLSEKCAIDKEITENLLNDFMNLLSCDDVDQLFLADQRWNTLLRAMEKIDSKQIWLTLLSNPNPYFRRITQNKQIKTFFHLSLLNTIYSHATDIKNNDRILFVKSISGLDKFILFLPQVKGFLVGGFVMEETNHSISNCIDNIMKMQELFQSGSLIFSREELQLLASKRLPITRERLEEQAKVIRDIFVTLFDINAQNKNILSLLKRDDLGMLLGSISFFCDKHRQENIMERFVARRVTDDRDSNRLSQISIFHGINNKYALEHRFSNNGDAQTARYYAELCAAAVGGQDLPESGQFLLSARGCMVKRTTKLLRILKHRFQNYREDISIKTKSRESEFLLEIQESLYNSFQDESLEQKLKSVITKAVHLVGADSGSFMWYHATGRYLEIMAYFGEVWRDIDKYKSDLKEWASSIAGQREQSSSYRAFDEKRGILIRDTSEDKEKCIQWFPIESSVTVPIFFHERPLGVMNVDGFSKYQFTINNLLALTDLARNIAPYIYEQNFQYNIVSLTNAALSQDKEDRDKLTEICKIITAIFFCAGASIWLRDDCVVNLYKMEAFHNFELKRPRRLKDYVCNIDDKIIGRAIATKEIQIIDNVEKPDAQVMFKDNLLAQGYHSMMVAPIMVPNDPVPIATINIYDHSMTLESLSISKPLLNVISQLLGRTILMIKGMREGERNLREVAAHELGQAITSLTNVKERLSSNFFDKVNMLPENFDKRLIKLLDGDFEEYLGDARKTLNSLVSDRAIVAARKGAEHVDILISSLLEGDKQWIDIRELINNILHGEIRKIRRKGIEFKGLTQDFIFEFHKAVVTRVISNVINNAIKYTMPPLSAVRLTLYEDAYIQELIVTNTGIELCRGDWENIFHKGFRTDQAKDMGEEGAGMGLYLARKLARTWEGRVYVKESEPIREAPGLYKTSIAIVFPKKNY